MRKRLEEEQCKSKHKNLGGLGVGILSIKEMFPQMTLIKCKGDILTEGIYHTSELCKGKKRGWGLLVQNKNKLWKLKYLFWNPSSTTNYYILTSLSLFLICKRDLKPAISKLQSIMDYVYHLAHYLTNVFNICSFLL